jgi:hypothetical protein
MVAMKHPLPASLVAGGLIVAGGLNATSASFWIPRLHDTVTGPGQLPAA